MILKQNKGYIITTKGKPLNYHNDVKVRKIRKKKYKKDNKRINVNVMLDGS